MAQFSTDIPHVVKTKGKRGDAYKLRRVVPVDCRDIIGRQNWIKTWKAGTAVGLVEREAALLSQRHDHEISVARGQAKVAVVVSAESEARAMLANKADAMEVLAFLLSEGTVNESERVFVNALEHGGTYQPESLRLSAALARDQERYGAGRIEKPFEQAVKSFIEVVGDSFVNRINRDMVSKWLTTKRKAGWSPATAKRRLASLSAVVGRCYLDDGIEKPNPFAKHRINGGGHSASDKLPFSRAMLDRIDRYLSGRNRLVPETILIVQMIQNTASGPSEIGGLMLADVSLDGEVPFIWIRERAEGLRGVKNANRDRKVPLVGVSLTAAQDAVKRAVARAGNKAPETVPLFKCFDVVRGADKLSAKLNKVIRTALSPIKSKRITTYSYRHTVKQALKVSGARDYVQRAITGHSGHGVADDYGAPQLRLEELRDALVAALPYMGDVDPASYSEAERLE